MTMLFARQQRRRSGATLIIVLALVTIVTILILAYLGTVQIERGATQSYSERLTADQIALGGLDRQVADLRQEIVAGSTANTDPNNDPGAPVYYKPNFPQCMAPARYSDTSTLYTNLIRISSTNSTYYNAAYSTTIYTNAAPSVPPLSLAVASSTLTPAPNGGYISTARWQKAQLLVPGETMPAPDWILMTRSGPTNAAGLAPNYFGTTGNTLNNQNPSNPNYVVGRYAYVVYNEGGLLDATVAGAPSVANADDLGNRGSLGLAPLTNSVFTTPTQIAALTGWRNLASGASETSYTNYVYNVAATNGFLQVQPGDNTFLSRQDLIAYANYAGIASSLPYLGTFSRTVNAPAYIPPATAASPNLDPLTQRFAAGGTINGSGTLLKSRTVNAGDFLISRRFPLSRLSWVGYNGLANGASAYDVWRAFGLVWDSSNNAWDYVSGAGSGSTPPTASVTNTKAAIETLAQVASGTYTGDTTPRDPDFFELLQAGILNGTLGQTGGAQGNGSSSSIYGANGDVVGYDSVTTYHTMQIGVNTMDQASPDSYPIAIRFGPDSNDVLLSANGGTGPGGPRTFYGAENLPYISRVIDTYARWLDPTAVGYNNTDLHPYPVGGIPPNYFPGSSTYTDPYVGGWLQFELWNPHQTANLNTTTLYPTAIRIVASGEVQPQISCYTGGTWGQFPAQAILRNTLSPTPGSGSNTRASVLQLNTAALSLFSEPKVVGYSDVTSAGCGANCAQDGTKILGTAAGTSGSSFAGLYLSTEWAPDYGFSGNNPGTRYPISPATSSMGATATYDPYLLTYSKERMDFNALPAGVTYALQYTTDANPGSTIPPDADWHTYSQVKNVILAYLHNLPISTGSTQNISELNVANSDAYTEYMLKIDPRTDRFSTSDARGNLCIINASGNNFTSPFADPVNLSPTVNYPESYNPTGSPTTSPTAAPPIWSSQQALPYTYTANGRATTWTGTSILSGSSAPTSTYHITAAGAAGGYIPVFYLGAIAQNTSSSAIYYSDFDGVTRRGDAAYATLSSTASLADGILGVWNASTANGTINLARPIILNRPLRSVGELGYAFRDLPFKTLDFFTKDSGDAALLDFFSVSDAPVVAGRIDVNTRNPAALAEVLLGGAINPLHAISGDGNASSLSTTQATTLANALVAFTTTTPMRSLSELVTTATAANSGTPETILSDLSTAYSSQNSKIQREAAIRTLGEAGNTRTWNLLIDIVAQSGRYPPSLAAGASFDNFIPDGEKHYWLHVAIDRYTGQVVDFFREPVQE